MDNDLIINRIKEIVHEKDSDADAFLFGSRARGDHHKNSDWDLLILVNAPKITNEIEDQFRDGLYDVELETDQVISVFIYPKHLWKSGMRYSPLYRNVEAEGIRL